LKQVVTSQNHVNWGLDNQGGLWFMATDKPLGPHPQELWIHVPYTAAKMADLDVGRDGIVWGCDVNGAPVVREGITEFEHSGLNWIAQGDDQLDNCARIAVCTSGHVWVVT